MNVRSITLCLFGLVALQSPFSEVQGQDYRQESEKARRELAPYFRKQVAIQAGLVQSTGPEAWDQAFPKYKLVGCPEQPLNPADPTKNLTFRTAGPGLWAGDVDAINIAERWRTQRKC
jgi:hypothetical protein